MLFNVLYGAALLFASPMILYRMVRHGRYRRGIGEKLLGLTAAGAARLRQDRNVLWIHAVSVGEVNLLPGLVEQLEQQLPDHAIVISTSTDTGYELAVKQFGAARVFFCPLDFTWAVKRTLRNLSPKKLILAELELWPNLIRAARQQGCPVMVVNGRLSARSAQRYQRLGRWTQPTFARLDWVGCQDELCLERFAACGVRHDRLQVTGSMKFDDAPASRETPEVQSRAQWAGIDPWQRVWIAGSTQAGEEQMAIDIYQSLRVDHPELRLILVPRHKERFDEVAGLVCKNDLELHRRSCDPSLWITNWASDKVILIDTIGELRHWWGVAQIATVGGSFYGDRGGQNMLEPAGYGCAVSFGPDTRNFDQIASRLVDEKGAIRAGNAAELRRFVLRCLTDIPAADALGRAARCVVRQHRGATERTVTAICDNEGAVRRAA